MCAELNKTLYVFVISAISNITYNNCLLVVLEYCFRERETVPLVAYCR